MNALEIQIAEPYKAELREAAVPTLAPTEVLIRALYSGVSSGTELAVYTGIHQWLKDPDYPEWRFPYRAGYSAYGVVEAVGSEVSRVSPGDAVAYAGRHAALGVYPEEAVWRDPYGAPPSAAALGCVARYGWGAAARIGAVMGKSVFVMGLGAVGQFAARSFIAAGAYPVVGLDPFENRRSAALQGGASAALDPTADQFEAQASALLGEARADVVADATGSPQLTMNAAALTKDGGTCVVVGSPRGLADGVNFYPDLHRRWIEMVGAHGDFLWSPTAAALGWNVDKAMDWILAHMANGRLNTDGLPSRLADPRDAQDVYDQLLNRKGEAVCVSFDWSRV